MFAVCLLLFGLLFTVSSCDNDHIPNGGDPELPTGELIPVNFTVSKMEYGEGGVVMRQALLGDDTPPVTLRGDTIPLDPDVIVRIVVYGGITYDSYYGYADYMISGGLLTPYPLGSNPLSVPMGTFNFVAYSFNNDNDALFPPYIHQNPVPVIGSQDLMWGDSVATITPASMDVHITMQHKMTRVVVRATTGLTSTDFMNSADINILCYEPELDVQTGKLDTSSVSLMPKAFTWDITNERLTTQISDTLYVYTGETNPTRLSIDQMRINYNTYTGPFDVVYHKPLEGGNTYELLVQFNWTRGGAADRITWDDTKKEYAITRDPTDAGLYFKFGSVVGLFSDVEDGVGKVLTLPGKSNSIPATDTVFNHNPSRDIAWSPYPIGDWASVPFYNAYPDLVTPESGYHTRDSVKAGKGDPCRLVGMDLNYIKLTNASLLDYNEIDNGIWRLPTAQENEWFTDGTVGNPPPKDHWWSSSSLPLTPFLSPFSDVAGAEFPEQGSGVATEARKARFLPAAGCRNSANGNAITVLQGIAGYYWSNQPGDDSFTFGGNAMLFFPWAVYSSDLNFEYLNWGFSVRCVRQYMNFEITVDDWIPGPNGGDLGTGNVVL